jgi:hypothetical protein
MDRRRAASFVFALAVAVLLAGAHAVQGVDTGLLFLAPALLIIAPLVAGRYLGERTLARWAGAMPVRRRLPAADVRFGHATSRASVSGGLLLARHIAGRGPPVSCTAA